MIPEWLVFIIIALVIVVPALVKQHTARNRIVKPYVGDTITGRDDKDS
jgi:hypothetical protein